MNRFAGLGFLVLLLGCAQEGVGIGVEATDTLPNVAPRRGGYDAGSAPDSLPGASDTIAIPDTTPVLDTRFVSDVIAVPDGISVDSRPPLDSSTPDRIADATPISDVQVLPDGLSYPHDIAPTPATSETCMQQVILNGYASDKASCATLETAPPGYHTTISGVTVEAACVWLIDCYAANVACTGWYASGIDCPCLGMSGLAPKSGLAAWTALIDIITPFCPTFMQKPD